ncbi:MAG: DUF6048 family protein [Cytophagales bacterium]|nr:DUF6048 family protein [Cytophagales bacterium]
MRLLLSIVLFSGCVFCTLAQESDSLTVAATDSVAAEDSPGKKTFNLGFHIDYGKVLTLPFDFENKIEGGVVLEIVENIELVGEYGFWDKSSNQAIENGTYNSTGSYYRAGMGFSFPFNTPGNRIGIGFRYASSQFDDEGTYTIDPTDNLSTEFTDSFQRQNLSATWISGVLTSVGQLKLRKSVPESPLNRMFRIGLQLRWRFLLDRDRFGDPSNPEVIEVYTIPGYGRTLADSNLAMNFFIRFYPFGI